MTPVPGEPVGLPVPVEPPDPVPVVPPVPDGDVVVVPPVPDGDVVVVPPVPDGDVVVVAAAEVRKLGSSAPVVGHDPAAHGS
jgi:hypothetical protein